MFVLPDFSTFAAVAADPKFLAAVGIAVLAGAVRGFSGFGSALIYIPLMSAVYGPQIAAATFLLIDVVSGFAFLARLWRMTVWREVLPLAVSAVVAAQFGALILLYADATALRWTISLVALAVVVVLAAGWRYHGRPRLAITVLVGLLAGVLGGALQMSGPPILVYWLGSGYEAVVMRANFIGYFSLFSTGVVVIYFAKGLISAGVLALALLIGPLHIAAMWGGTLLFNLASDTTYRRIAYAIIAFAALASMPLVDGLIRSAAHLGHQRVRHLEIGVDVLHVVVLVRASRSASTASRPVSSSTATVFCGFQVSAALRGSPNFASSALATSRKVSCEV